jgi:hypothetical protein
LSLKGENYAFRDQVVLLHHDRGLTSARRAGEPRNQQQPRGDVLGLPVTVAVRNAVTIDLSGALREAQAEAEAEGHDVYVSVQRRHGQPVEQSFVTMPLDVWLTVLRRMHPELVSE